MKTSSFSGKVAAITGAGSGIGRGLSLALASRGCALALSDIDEKGLAETAALAPGVRVTTRTLDVSNAEDFRSWAAEVVRDHSSVNLIFNNAGISYGATVEGGDDADFRRVMDVNFFGVVNGTRAFLPHLNASGDGHVINISSVFGIIAFPGQAAYNSAKFAVRGFTECLRIELDVTGSAVTATCVHPGGIKTNIARASKMHPSMTALGIKMENAVSEFEKNIFRTTADEAADIILRGVAKNARRVLVGSDAYFVDWMQRTLPTGYQSLLVREARRRLPK
jgi:NAD(P)-dependent dehydrogenase (short-subunit alcohol dehydrogenase family)